MGTTGSGPDKLVPLKTNSDDSLTGEVAKIRTILSGRVRV
jgi:hypothetical protein